MKIAVRFVTPLIVRRLLEDATRPGTIKPDAYHNWRTCNNLVDFDGPVAGGGIHGR
jgi:hypothetical protein